MFAERTTEPPVQKDVAGAAMLAAGKLFTVIVFPADVAEHVPLLTATVYVLAAVALYVALVAPEIIPALFDH